MTKRRRIVFVLVAAVVAIVIPVPMCLRLCYHYPPCTHSHTHIPMCLVMPPTHTHAARAAAPLPLVLPISVGGAANSVLKPHVEASASASVDALRAFLAKRCNSQIQIQLQLQNMKANWANGGHLNDSPEILSARANEKEGNASLSLPPPLSASLPPSAAF